MEEVVSASTHLTPTWAVLPFVGYLLLIGSRAIDDDAAGGDGTALPHPVAWAG